MSVPARMSIVTLGVDDLERSITFYRGLGWPAAGGVPGDIHWFKVGGVYVGLWDRRKLAEDAGAALPPEGYGNITLAVNVDSDAAVDAALEAAVVAGGTVVVDAERMEWGGYRGYFADPDGHRW